MNKDMNFVYLVTRLLYLLSYAEKELTNSLAWCLWLVEQCHFASGGHPADVAQKSQDHMQFASPCK